MNNLAPSGARYKTASGDILADEGGVRVKAEDEYGMMRSLTGRLCGVHKPLVSASQMASAGYYTWLNDAGGFIVQRESSVGRKISQLLGADSQRADSTLLPVYKESGVYNFYLKKGDRGEVSAIADDLSGMSRDELARMVSRLRLSAGSGHPVSTRPPQPR